MSLTGKVALVAGALTVWTYVPAPSEPSIRTWYDVIGLSPGDAGGLQRTSTGSGDAPGAVNMALRPSGADGFTTLAPVVTGSGALGGLVPALFVLVTEIE